MIIRVLVDTARGGPRRADVPANAPSAVRSSSPPTLPGTGGLYLSFGREPIARGSPLDVSRFSSHPGGDHVVAKAGEEWLGRAVVRRSFRGSRDVYRASAPDESFDRRL